MVPFPSSLRPPASPSCPFRPLLSFIATTGHSPSSIPPIPSLFSLSLSFLFSCIFPLSTFYSFFYSIYLNPPRLFLYFLFFDSKTPNHHTITPIAQYTRPHDTTTTHSPCAPATNPRPVETVSSTIAIRAAPAPEPPCFIARIVHCFSALLPIALETLRLLLRLLGSAAQPRMPKPPRLARHAINQSLHAASATAPPSTNRLPKSRTGKHTETYIHTYIPGRATNQAPPPPTTSEPHTPKPLDESRASASATIQSTPRRLSIVNRLARYRWKEPRHRIHVVATLPHIG